MQYRPPNVNEFSNKKHVGSVSDSPVNNLSGFASLFANQCQPPVNQCDIWFADTANQNMDQLA